MWRWWRTSKWWQGGGAEEGEEEEIGPPPLPRKRLARLLFLLLSGCAQPPVLGPWAQKERARQRKGCPIEFLGAELYVRLDKREREREK